MTSFSSVPHAAIAAGMPARYRYWRGRSGARYLFSQVPAKSIDDFDDGVFLLVRFGTIVCVGDHSAVAASMAEGDRGTVAPSSAQNCRGAVLYVHLLATSRASAASIANDLSGTCGAHGLAIAA